MTKDKTEHSRQTYHKRKQLKKIYFSLAVLVIMIASFIFFTRGQKATPKIADIGGPKVKVNQLQPQASSTAETTTSSATNKNQEREIDTTDQNIKRAFQNPSWQISPTTQKEPHSINFEDHSIDRQEMKVAITTATNLQPDDLIEWWLTGAGDNRINATVSNLNKEQIFSVHLAWVKDRGWLVEQVDELKSLPDFQKN